eukprot:355261-Chlamydomonas_euryale.AAC.1
MRRRGALNRRRQSRGCIQRMRRRWCRWRRQTGPGGRARTRVWTHRRACRVHTRASPRGRRRRRRTEGKRCSPADSAGVWGGCGCGGGVGGCGGLVWVGIAACMAAAQQVWGQGAGGPDGFGLMFGSPTGKVGVVRDAIVNVGAVMAGPPEGSGLEWCGGVGVWSRSNPRGACNIRQLWSGSPPPLLAPPSFFTGWGLGRRHLSSPHLGVFQAGVCRRLPYRLPPLGCTPAHCRPRRPPGSAARAAPTRSLTWPVSPGCRGCKRPPPRSRRAQPPRSAPPQRGGAGQRPAQQTA